MLFSMLRDLDLIPLYRMIHDKKVLGVCGETELANAKQSIITMMQVRQILTLNPFKSNEFYRFMSTSFPIIWQRHLRVSSVQ